MNIIYITLLGIVQGLTEFLPVSSSGHIFLTKTFMDVFTNSSLPETPLMFIILLHIATLCAILLFTRKILLQLIASIFTSSAKYFKKTPLTQNEKSHLHLTLMLAIATFATLPIGLLFKQFAEAPDPFLVSISFLATSILLASTAWKNTSAIPIKDGNNSIIHIHFSHAICIGLIQGVAVLPGISRSGVTIAIAILMGARFYDATYFSFLLAIPAILASFISIFFDTISIESISIFLLAIGMFFAFIFGLLGLWFLEKIVKTRRLWYFSLYLIIPTIAMLFIAYAHSI